MIFPLQLPLRFVSCFFFLSLALNTVILKGGSDIPSDILKVSSFVHAWLVLKIT